MWLLVGGGGYWLLGGGRVLPTGCVLYRAKLLVNIILMCYIYIYIYILF